MHVTPKVISMSGGRHWADRAKPSLEGEVARVGAQDWGRL